MDNRFYVPGAGWDLLSKTLRNVKDGDNITDEYYAVIMDIIEATKEQPKLRFYVRMLQPCDPNLKGTPHDFCVNPIEAESDMYQYYTRQHTMCEVPKVYNHGIKKGLIVKIKLNKKTSLNKTYVDTSNSIVLDVFDEDTSKELFPTIFTTASQKIISAKETQQKNLTSATTIGNYSIPTEVGCFNLGDRQLYNGFMPDDLIQTVEDYCKGEGVKCSENVVKIDKHDKPVRLYKGIMPDYIKFCDTYYDLVTKKHPKLSLKINQSYRSLEEQVKLKANDPKTAASPGTSNHSWGLAIDIANTNRFENGDYIVPSDNEMRELAARIGIEFNVDNRLRLQRGVILEKSYVRNIIFNKMGNFTHPFTSTRSNMPESWHYEVKFANAFGNVKINKCPTPGTQPQVENTTGSKAGEAESIAGDVEPTEDGANDADTSGSTTEQPPAEIEAQTQ